VIASRKALWVPLLSRVTLDENVRLLKRSKLNHCLSSTGAYAADKLGRRWGVQVALVIFNVGVAMQVSETINALGLGLLETA